jgi:hypothetical protein
MHGQSIHDTCYVVGFGATYIIVFYHIWSKSNFKVCEFKNHVIDEKRITFGKC